MCDVHLHCSLFGIIKRGVSSQYSVTSGSFALSGEITLYYSLLVVSLLHRSHSCWYVLFIWSIMRVQLCLQVTYSLFAVYHVQHAICSEHCAVWTVQPIMCTVFCAVCSVHCAVSSSSHQRRALSASDHLYIDLYTCKRFCALYSKVYFCVQFISLSASDHL